MLVLFLIGINAISAGYGFIGSPDGSTLGIPQGWLDNSPFRNYRVPGILLFGLGVLYMVATYSEFHRHRSAPLIALASGIGLVIWIVVQAMMMGSFRHPMQTILQAACLILGLSVIILSWVQLNYLHHRKGARN